MRLHVGWAEVAREHVHVCGYVGWGWSGGDTPYKFELGKPKGIMLGLRPMVQVCTGPWKMMLGPVCGTWCRDWKESMPCQGFSQMLSGSLHHCQWLLLNIQIMCTMHCQGTFPSGRSTPIVFLISIIWVKGKISKKSTFSLCIIKKSVLPSLKGKIRLGIGQSIQGYGENEAVSLTVGLTVLPREVGSEKRSNFQDDGGEFRGLALNGKDWLDFLGLFYLPSPPLAMSGEQEEGCIIISNH